MSKTRSAVLAASLAFAAPALAGDTYSFDKAHTNVGFQVRHIFTNVSGKFTDFAGTIQVDRAKPESSTVEFTIQATSIDTSDQRRDQHLRSADFFDAEAFPDITFVSTGITRVRGDQFEVTGDLTIRETTKPVAFDVRLEGIVPGMSGARHVGLSATTSIAREDWGLNWNVALEQGGWLVGKEIKLEITIAADEVAVAEPADLVGSTR